MNHQDLERTYESLARTVDEVGEANSELFLAQLALLLAHDNGDVEHVHQRILDAAESFDAGELDAGTAAS